MATVLGVNAVFHDPSAAIIVDGEIVAAVEEERISRRKHGKLPVPFSTWELPENAIRACLEAADKSPDEIDHIAYSYDPSLAQTVRLVDELPTLEWEGLRTLFAQRVPNFLATACPGLNRAAVQFVPHHVAHAASAYLTSGWSSCATLVLDGRGERGSHLAGHVRNGCLETLATQDLPHSLGLFYEELTAHLGFRRSSDEYKVMALASYGQPTFLDALRDAIRVDGEQGTFTTEPIQWHKLAPPSKANESFSAEHIDLACSAQRRLEEVLLELAKWLHRQTGQPRLALAGGVALNCVANSRLWREGPFEEIWIQPAAGDAGTALGGALYTAQKLGDRIQPMKTAALGRGWSDQELGRWLNEAGIETEEPASIATAAAEVLANNGVVAWFQGRSEFGPRALGHRSLLADPRRAENLDRLNAVKGREQFRPVAPMVLTEKAGEIFSGPLPSPFMLFTHNVSPAWRKRIPAAVHVDGTARIQTVSGSDEPLMAELLKAFEAQTGVPVVVNTSLNTAGRPMVDSPRDALECFGSSPIDALVLGPYIVRRDRPLTSSQQQATPIEAFSP